MSGVITTKHLVTQVITIVQCFGLGVYIHAWMCVLTRKKTTFLSVIYGG